MAKGKRTPKAKRPETVTVATRLEKGLALRYGEKLTSLNMKRAEHFRGFVEAWIAGQIDDEPVRKMMLSARPKRKPKQTQSALFLRELNSQGVLLNQMARALNQLALSDDRNMTGRLAGSIRDALASNLEASRAVATMAKGLLDK